MATELPLNKGLECPKVKDSYENIHVSKQHSEALPVGKSHPRHYMMHKYWGRKAHNHVSHFIELFSKSGETVLDPFMGSGGTVIEAKKLNRNAIGIDLNPVSALIVENTVSGFSSNTYEEYSETIISALPPIVDEITIVNCNVCGAPCVLENAIWKDEQLIRLKGKCSVHGTFRKGASVEDVELVDKAISTLAALEKVGQVRYPKNALFDFVKRNGRNHIHELFSPRNLLVSALLLSEIQKIEDQQLKKLYLMTFTSMLPNVSAMIPGDEISVTGKSGWQISKFWVPNTRTEKNVIQSFKSRVQTISAGLRETEGMFGDSSVTIYTKSSESMTEIASNSVDFIFADPPYGDSIAYLGLSMFWNSWLENEVDYASEIIYDSYRGKNYESYQEGLNKVFSESSRVLKKDRHMVVTFNNRKIKFWRILMQAISNSGFELVNVEWQDQAVASGTQGINRDNTLRGDFVYTFINKKKSKPKVSTISSSAEELILGTADRYFIDKQVISSAELYCLLIPEIVKHSAYFDKNGRDLDIEKIMSTSFEYVQLDLEEEQMYGWVRK